FVIAPPQALRGAFARDKQVVAFEDVTLEVEGRPTPCARVVLRQPWKTPEYREKAREFGSTPLEADIPFQHRFIYDMDLGAAVRVVGTTGDPKGRYWTDLFLVAERFEPCDPFRPALRILSFDIENSIRDGHIFCIGVAYREAGEIKTRILTGNEKEIIERFVKLIDELDPDVISGYNIDGYDLPVLIERAAKHGMQRLSLARDHSTFFHLGERFWRLDGRILTDVWWAVRAEMRPKQETLDYVAKHLLGEGKHELQRRRIDEEWEADRDKVIRYCIQDAELSLRILERVRRIEKTLDLAAVSQVPPGRGEEGAPPGHPCEPDEGPPGGPDEAEGRDGPPDEGVLRGPAGRDQGPHERVLRSPRIVLLPVQRPEGGRLDHRLRARSDQGNHRGARGRRREGRVCGHRLRLLPVPVARPRCVARLRQEDGGAVLPRPNLDGGRQDLRNPLQPWAEETVRRQGRVAGGAPEPDGRARVRDPPDGRLRPPKRRPEPGV